MGDGAYHAWKEQKDKEREERKIVAGRKNRKIVTGHNPNTTMRVVSLGVPQVLWNDLVRVLQDNGALLHDPKLPHPRGEKRLDVWFPTDAVRSSPPPDYKDYFLESSGQDKKVFDRVDDLIREMAYHICPTGEPAADWVQDHRLGRTVWDSFLGFRCEVCGTWMGITQATFQALPSAWDNLLGTTEARDILAVRVVSDKDKLLAEIDKLETKVDAPSLTREDLQEALNNGQVFIRTDQGLQAAPKDILG